MSHDRRQGTMRSRRWTTVIAGVCCGVAVAGMAAMGLGDARHVSSLATGGAALVVTALVGLVCRAAWHL